MWVFAVAHFLYFVEMQVQRLRISAARCVCFVFAEASQIVGDRTIVLCGVSKDFFCQREFGVIAHDVIVGFHFREHNRVIAWINDDSDVFMIFSRRTQHRWTTDVDVFNRVF